MPQTRTHARTDEDLRLLSVKEVAEILGVSRRTVWSMISCGYLRREKVGRMTRVRRSEVREFVLSDGAEIGTQA